MVQSEGGDGFIVRQLADGWGKVSSAYKLFNDIEDLQDQMRMVLQSCTALSQNQRGLTLRVDQLVDKLDAMES